MIMMLRITPHSLRGPAISPHKPPYRDETVAAETAILAKRMTEELTGYFASPREERGAGAISHVPRGFTRRVGAALAGSSGQGCRG